jgi:hypothetical protein
MEENTVGCVCLPFVFRVAFSYLCRRSWTITALMSFRALTLSFPGKILPPMIVSMVVYSFCSNVGLCPKYPTMNVLASVWCVVDASRSQDYIEEQDEYYVPVHEAWNPCCFGPECAEDGVRCRDTVKQGAVASLQQST